MIIAATDSDDTIHNHARFGASNTPITITTNAMPNCRSPGRSNRFSTCQRKNRRTIVSPLDGSKACSANSSSWPAPSPAVVTSVAFNQCRRSPMRNQHAHKRNRGDRKAELVGQARQ